MKKLKNPKDTFVGNKKGFTLVELLLVVALLAISVGVTGDILLSLVRSFSKTQVLTEIEQQANFVSQKLEKELKSADNISNPAQGGSGNTIAFSLNGTGVTYALNGGILTRNGENITSNENPGGVSVTCSHEWPNSSNGCFYRENISQPTTVSFFLTFNQAQTGAIGAFTGDIVIHKTVVLRKTY